jgi:RNA polymerase sigma-70 factor (ECF subfamily)
MHNTRGLAIWERLSPVAKTILNLSIPGPNDPINIDEIRVVQNQLADFFQTPVLSIKRLIAVEIKTLATASIKNTGKQIDVKKEVPLVTHQLTTVDQEKGIILSNNGQQYNFTDIYAAFQSKIYHHLYRIYGDRERAFDDVQEVFARFWSKLGSLEDPNLLIGPYLYRMAANLANDRYRREKLIHFVSLNKLSSESDADNSDISLEDIIPTVELEDPAAEIDKENESAILNEAISLLPSRYRLVIGLIDFDDLSMIETADVLGCSRLSVKSLHFRAKQELRRRLAQSGKLGS